MALLIVIGGISRYRRSVGKGKAQRQFFAAVKACQKALVKNGSPIQVVSNAFDHAHKRWAETTWKVNDIYVKLAMNFPDLYYQVSSSASGPWVDVSAILEQRVGVTLEREPASFAFIVASINGHLAHWWLVRSFLLDPGVEARLAELKPRP